ncbi:leukocyte elastase inhibitor-like isoform 1-T2 [Clarias gariepinus]|uniref:leukocyte elastase inhibitor-like isoform X1 n=1 Tax=Clarias gariepinus TaxID=13013 RepID=UPI00234E0F6F|nr:leukocyte elastase inhibitor-like isoform X1 [Clarias gariepinus]XP_053345108.1 leukocyte elastase inhibitor-like isoform X1 [Clarias gariepinus]
MESLSHANSAFALELYRAISAENPNGNLFISPLSISAALSMVYLGARGGTAEEMAKVLSFSSVPDVHTHFKTLNSAINSPKASYILRLANRLYGEKTLNFLSEYVDSTQKFYHGDMQAVDFIGSSEESRKLINQWVEEKTEGKIKDILQRRTVTTLTRLALVNAIYFKGKWKHAFNTEDTKEMPFKINQNETTPVQMMYQKEKFLYNYIDEYKLQVLDLPYVEEELSMVVLLPEESVDGSDPLEKLESELTVDKLTEWTNPEKMHRWTDIIVHLPKFKLEEQYSLTDILSKMGMSSLFQAGAANLKGMSSQEDLIVSSVTHKAFVETNEEGTEAAAATVTMVIETIMLTPEKHFMADHPFLFFIRHNNTKSILFFGKFTCPK